MTGDYEKQENVTRSGNRNLQQQLQSLQDFMNRTMNVLQGMWSKLNYIRELRTEEGQYSHWGLARTYGKEATEKMIAGVHSQLYLQTLRTPLRELFSQLEISAIQAGCSRAQLARQLHNARRRLIPKDLQGGAPEHMRSVLVIAELMSKYSKTGCQQPNPQ